MASNFTNNVISAINIKDVKYDIKAVPFHATEAEWNGMSYIPKQGEFIVYDVDSNNTSPRFKTGDGVTDVKKLPFTLATISEVQAYVNSQISSAGYLKRIVLEDGAELPDISKAEVDTIYMKRNSESRLISDVFDEYMVINGAWEIIGNTRVDLSDYTTQEMVDEKIETAISNIDFPEEIYINDEAPENPKENALWLDTDEEAAVSGGSASIDVTASVGQTIVVEEVDANGKPTKWKAADYQEKICGSEEVVVLEETTVVPDGEGSLMFAPLSVPSIGDTCKVTYNGTEFECEAMDGSVMTQIPGTILLGNIDLFTDMGDTGEPFIMVIAMAGEGGGQLMPMDDSVTFVLSIKAEAVIKMPVKYIPNEVAAYAPYYLNVFMGIDAEDNPAIRVIESVTTLEALVDAGRMVIAKRKALDGAIYYLPLAADSNTLSKRTFTFYAGNFGLRLVPQDDGSYIGEEFN